jgi:hypothetical protein
LSECRLVVPAASALAAAALAVCVSGCGSTLVPVRGSVQREGGVLSDGRVVFTPIGGGKTAFGEIQSDGAFQLTTERTNDGAPPGTYHIRIIQTKSTDAGKLYTSYVTRDKTLEVIPGKSNEFDINIREQDGWQTHQDN